ALGAFYSVWEKGNLGPVADESHVIKEDCTVLDPEKPDVIELMSPYDATYDSSMVPAKKAGDILFRDHKAYFRLFSYYFQITYFYFRFPEHNVWKKSVNLRPLFANNRKALNLGICRV
ncbi:MAG: hypothetical protein MRZ60_03330, partial [Blautia sp.]|nr:hypothetical protein [Blautia sp.]